MAEGFLFVWPGTKLVSHSVVILLVDEKKALAAFIASLR
jgi:hypothetical protein